MHASIIRSDISLSRPLQKSPDPAPASVAERGSAKPRPATACHGIQPVSSPALVQHRIRRNKVYVYMPLEHSCCNLQSAAIFISSDPPSCVLVGRRAGLRVRVKPVLHLPSGMTLLFSPSSPCRYGGRCAQSFVKRSNSGTHPQQRLFIDKLRGINGHNENNVRFSAPNKQMAMLTRSPFSSSPSANVPFNSIPKFPIPRYNGRSQPVPKVIITPATQNGQQGDMAEEYQLQISNAIRPSHQSQTPLLLKDLIANCDATFFWRSLEYWRVAVGEETLVDIEVGKSYNTGKRVPTRFGDYLDYLAMSLEQEAIEYKEYEQLKQEQAELQRSKHAGQDVAYLAQNELFPQVLNDVPIPQFCDDKNHNVGEGKRYHSMLWMGPRHSISPLHFDPLDNLLMQVVGWKRVLLFPPKNISDDGSRSIKQLSNGPTWHYAGTDGNQYNTSSVDIENIDHDRFPNFEAMAPTPFECLLGPGDGLFIPKRWWHHVRSLEMSISANVWWR
ncbi:hypothetical protein ACHAWF_012905 [Thalassiosira exigua]